MLHLFFVNKNEKKPRVSKLDTRGWAVEVGLSGSCLGFWRRVYEVIEGFILFFLLFHRTMI